MQTPLILKFHFGLGLVHINGIFTLKIYNERDDLNFEKFNFPFLDGDVPRSPYFEVY